MTTKLATFPTHTTLAQKQALKLTLWQDPQLEKEQVRAQDKLKLTGWNLGRVFNYRHGCAYVSTAIRLITRTAKLKVINLALITFRLYPINFRTKEDHLKMQIYYFNNISDFSKTFGGQNYNPYLNAIGFFNTREN